MDLLADLEARGLVQDSTDRAALRARLAGGPVAVYYGCDPTADSLHVGNLIGLIMLRRFRDAGHRAIALAGGATGMVGDPSGRSEERNLLDAETLDRNVAAISHQIASIVGLSGGAALVDNRRWTQPMGLLEFLRDVGKHVTVNQMLGRESVRTRLQSDHGISFTEFSYMLLQANDYLWLYDNMSCELQVGGSDQWGNIVSGVDLIRRTRSVAVHAFSWPLLTAVDGSKLGKTAGARVWLDPARTSPYQFWQHWMNVDDADVGPLLRTFSLLPLAEVEALIAAHAAAPEQRRAQRALADEMTALVHGPRAAHAASSAAAVLFGSDPTQADEAAFAILAAEVPHTRISPAALDDVVAALVTTGLASSNGDARRTLKGGGYRVNGRPLTAATRLGETPLLHGLYLLLRKGRATHHLLEVSSTEG